MTDEELKILLDSAQQQSLHSNFPEAERLANQVLDNIQLNENGKAVLHEQVQLQCSALLCLANVHDLQGHSAKALECASLALRIADDTMLSTQSAKALSIIGNIYLGLGDYQNSIEQFKQVLAVAENLGNRELFAQSLSNLGRVYERLSDFATALGYYDRALAIAKEMNSSLGISIILGNIGNIHFYLSDVTLAIQNWQESLAICEQLGGKQGVARNYGNIGNAYASRSEYSRAHEYYSTALDISREIGKRDNVALFTLNNGKVYHNEGEHERAAEYMGTSLSIYEDLGDKSGIASALGALGELYADTAFAGFDIDKAEQYLLRAIDICSEIGSKRNEFHFEKCLADLYQHAERWRDSCIHFRNYHRIEKEIESDEVRQTATRYQIQREQAEVTVRLQTTEQLLSKTLPPSISKRLMKGERNIADRFESVSILFADIVGFTPLSARLEPKKLVELLNSLFSRFDRLTEEYGVERIKTIGDAYMLVAGAPEPCADHALRTAEVAVAMIDQTKQLCEEIGEMIGIRIGINSGETIGAVVGEVKFTYDVWSDAVNTASRMESHGEPGKIHVTEEYKRLVERHHSAASGHVAPFRFVRRGDIDIKGKGVMRTYFLEKA